MKPQTPKQAMSKKTGFTADEVIGKKVDELGTWVVPEERDAYVKLLDKEGVVSNIDLQPVVEQSLRLLRPTLPSNIDIYTRFAELTPKINFDPAQLEQIIMNLCINARDVIEASGNIDIDVENELDAEHHAGVIMVVDDEPSVANYTGELLESHELKSR